MIPALPLPNQRGEGILPQQCFCRMQRQSAVVVLAADVELLGIAVISGFKRCRSTLL
jgi:hypothetical protein